MSRQVWSSVDGKTWALETAQVTRDHCRPRQERPWLLTIVLALRLAGAVAVAALRRVVGP